VEGSKVNRRGNGAVYHSRRKDQVSFKAVMKIFFKKKKRQVLVWENKLLVLRACINEHSRVSSEVRSNNENYYQVCPAFLVEVSKVMFAKV